MALQLSAPQLQGQLLEPALHVSKPSGPTVQLLLWQVLQQLQSIDPNKNQCTMLTNELRMEKMRMRQERARREDFEEEAYKEIAKLRNEKKLSGINSDGVMLELGIKKSKLEALEKQLADERSSRIKLEVESEKCKGNLQQEQELNMLLGQELQTEKETREKENELRKSIEEEIMMLQNQLSEEKTLSVDAERELERERKHIKQLEEMLKNETMGRLSGEHQHLKQILELKNQISVLTGLRDMAENSKKLCDVAQTNLIEERDKVSKLKDELGDLQTDLYKINVEMGYEKKAALELKERLIKELDYGNRLKEELQTQTSKVANLENELKLAKKQASDENTQKDALMKKLEKCQINFNKEINQVMKLKENLETESRRIKELENKLSVVNDTDHELHIQNQSLEKKLQDVTRNLTIEQNKLSTLQQKFDNEAKEVSHLKRKLEIEKEISEQEKDRRKSVEKELERVKHLYVHCGANDWLSPLHRASEVCDVPEARSLMRSGYSAAEGTKGNSTWKTSVHLAVEAGCIDLVHLFALNKTLLNIWDENGATPLHEAAQYPNMNVVRVLVDNGAIINAWDKFGKTPLDYAGGNSNNEVMKLLIDRGAALGSLREFGPTTQKAERDDNDDNDYNYYY